MALTRVNGNLISSGTITGNLFNNNTITGDKIASATIGSSNLTSTGVSAGVYGGTGNTVSLIVDAQGRVTSAANVIATSSQWTSNGSNIHYDAGLVGLVGNPRGGNGGAFRSLEIGSSTTNTLTLFNQVNAAAGGLSVGSYFSTSNQGLYNVFSGQQPTRLYMNDGSFQFLNAPSGVAGNVATFTELMRISKTGCLVLANGSTSATGTGITFPATQSASSDANTLDDYEEGTWTPSLGGNTTYVIRAGTYTKIGRKVTAWFDIEVGTLGTGGGRVTGLPFALGASQYGIGTTGYWTLTPSNYVNINLGVVGTDISFVTLATSQNGVNNDTQIWGNTTRVQGFVTYNA